MLSGQIIEASVNRFPLIRHFGMLLVEPDGKVMVLHNTPFVSSTIDTLEDWLKSRTVLEIKDSPLISAGNSVILQRFESRCKKPYRLIDYNCEHFIDCMTGEKESSEQLHDFMLFVLISGLLVLVICLLRIK